MLIQQQAMAIENHKARLRNLQNPENPSTVTEPTDPPSGFDTFYAQEEQGVISPRKFVDHSTHKTSLRTRQKLSSWSCFRRRSHGITLLNISEFMRKNLLRMQESKGSKLC